MRSDHVVRLSDAKSLRPDVGVRFRPVFGDDVMLNVVDLEPHSGPSAHSHPEEQIGIVIEGELQLRVDGSSYMLQPYDAFRLPGGIVHSAVGGGSGCRVIDVFHPIRNDLRELWSNSY